MFPGMRTKSRKPRFIPWLELLEKREVLDATLRFHTQQITVSEQQTSTPVTVTVELSEPSAEPVEFFCNLLADGSATEEVDFHAHREHFIIPAGQTSLVTPLAHLYDDSEDEPAETFSLELVSVDGTLITSPLLDPEGNPLDNPGLVTITITDNDAPPLPPTALKGLIEPGRLAADQDTWQGGGLGVSLADGTVATVVEAGGVLLEYNGATLTNAVTQLRYYFDQTPPAEFTVRLSFQGNTTDTVYAGSPLEANQEIRLGVVIPSQGLPTGRYSYTVEVLAEGCVPQSYTGNLNWVNRSGSEYGAGWGLGGVEELVPCNGGVLLVAGDGSSLWYAEGTTPGSYLSPAGDTANLMRNSNGSFTRTLHNGAVTEFDSAGRMQSRTGRVGNRTVLAHDSSGRITSITDPYGHMTVLAFTSGLLTSVTDPEGRVTQLGQAGGNLTSVTGPDPDGSGPRSAPALTFGYNPQHQLTASTDPLGNSTQVNYDGYAKVASVTQPDGSITRIRSSQSQALPALSNGPAQPLLAENHQAVVTDGRGNQWKTELDTMGFGLALKRVDPLGNTTLLARNAQGWITSITDPLLRVTSLTLDSFGNVLTLMLPSGAATQYSYNPFGQLTQMVEPDVNLEDDLPGPTTTWVHDTLGNTVRQILPDEDGNPSNNPALIFSHDSHGLVSSSTDARGFTTRISRDTQGRVTQIRHPDDNSNPLDDPLQSLTYDVAGNLAFSTDELGNKTSYQHDLLGNLTGITHPDGNSDPLDDPLESFTYDVAGNQLTRTDALGNTTSFSYDSLNRVQTITGPDPDGSGPQSAAITRISHDAVGNLTKVVDPVGRESGWGYDEANRVVSQSRGNFWTTERRYDAAGQEVQVLGPPPDRNNPDNRMVFTKGYDPDGNQIYISDSMMWLKESRFNAWGELTGFT